MLGEGNWQYKYFETVDVASLLTKDIDFLFIEGSNCGTEEMVAFLDNHRAAIENWVSEGGNLLLNAAPNEGPDLIQVGFGDLLLTWVGDGSFGAFGESANPNHPMFKGPLTPTGSVWSGGAFAHFQVFGSDLSSVIKDAESAEVYLAEKEWGNGSVMVGGLTLAYFQEEFKAWAPIQEVSNIHKNLISYMARGRKGSETSEEPVTEVPAEEEEISAVVIEALTNNSFCQGTEVSVPFTATGTFNTGNTFSVQLSDASGNFSSFTTIGTVVGTGSGEIKVTVPANLSFGTNYRIRVVASSPEIASESYAVVINPLPAITAPAALTVNCTPGLCGATGVALGVPFITQNCVASLVNDAPATFPIGTTVVTWTLTDVAGNKATATQEVTVIGAIPVPAISGVSSEGVYVAGGEKVFYLGYGDSQVTLTASNSTSAPAATTYEWSSAAGLSNTTGASTVVQPTAGGVYTVSVTATNEFGCKATTSVTITVVDVRCGNKNDKVLVCHKGQEICVAPSAVQAHLDHGCSLGSCNGGEATATAASKVTGLQTEATSLVVYPNPFNESATIGFTLKQAGSYRLELMDVKGALVKEIAAGEGLAGSSYNYQLGNSKLLEGIYVVRIVTPGEVKTMKVIYKK
ncbi:T9SS type A sorting domain-containing protein [Botryobacter ruber]|uniref:T9SS type A sorting domain-containing protein n=1 Tax=Botryobacter ruber TaxID=2171629 RepID=UPI0013E2FE19|nr:T9SS type A sorting domain-containing protein [Botryobacter ruber]